MQIRTVVLVLAATFVLGPSQFYSGLAGPTERPAQVVDQITAIEAETAAAALDEQPLVSATLSPDERQLVVWATDRFALVGLDLPDVQVSFHDDAEPCDWNEGIYHGDDGMRLALICVPDHGTFASDLHRRRTLIHELAHAWEHAYLDDTDRERLLTVLDAEAWFTSDLTWEQRGGERFAETIVWGLYDQLRRPTLIDVPCAELHADFRSITGYSAQGPIEQACEGDVDDTADRDGKALIESV